MFTHIHILGYSSIYKLWSDVIILLFIFLIKFELFSDKMEIALKNKINPQDDEMKYYILNSGMQQVWDKKMENNVWTEKTHYS